MTPQDRAFNFLWQWVIDLRAEVARLRAEVARLGGPDERP